MLDPFATAAENVLPILMNSAMQQVSELRPPDDRLSHHGVRVSVSAAADTRRPRHR
jgi:hypothetical protein